ncbi:diaminopimelate epimerase [Phaeovulum vinaykumarii]|uniref:Diaminopimelate epimerase n=1 Tax=Phaeovulum vinaykumarii TaxID=407234 RepID=A0A1N7KS73_9RHOB|nr:diaminopimelate epimerase [Phaeovulum vinaykumarii]SIS64407.1 diaminopimelate epimerase [Phaeovulum vinaykumarii]SOC01591.1 diaminopimelate epimerase [Phaeovulum vinaykumarii]
MTDTALSQIRATGLPFMKMHGLGNDFVVIDTRGPLAGLAIPPALALAIADRRKGIGFDQLALIAEDDQADAHLTFLNADGSGSATCGNATRCIAAHLLAERGTDRLRLRTERGLLAAERGGAGITRVNMGAPILDWAQIPLAEPVDVDALPIPGAPLATSMGNPHCTFFVDDVAAVDLDRFGPAHEHHPLFPQRTNVQVAQITGPDRIRMRVWERGAGVTLASGSSSCATAVAAARRGLTGRRVTLDLDGGTLVVDWRDDGVWMEGPTAHVCDGVITPAFIAEALG